jgi:DNA polymerase-1
MSHYWRMPGDEPIVVDYATGDGISTWALYHRLMEEMAKVTNAPSDEPLERIWKLEQRVTRTLFSMIHRGIKIDVEQLNRVKEKLETEALLIRQELPEDFNERSGPKMLKLFTDAGYNEKDFAKTPTGRPSFTEDWLETNDLGRRIIELRQCTNLINSFVEPMLTVHLHAGRVHPNYNQLRGDEYGTISGRLSSNDPNIQQVPKRNKKLSKIFRSIFIPDEGMDWLSKDAKQCEPRIFAEYSQSQVLIDGYLQKPTIDLYNMMSKITGADRETCKRLALGIFYGAGINKTATLIGCTVAEATEYRNKLYQMVPEIPIFSNTAKDLMGRRGWVKTKWGRKLRIADFRFHYKSSNRIVQGCNADYIKLAVCDVHDYLIANDSNVLLTCHDSIESQIVKGRPEVQAEAIRIMEDAGNKMGFVIPQEVEFGSGRSWSEATFGAEA